VTINPYEQQDITIDYLYLPTLTFPSHLFGASSLAFFLSELLREQFSLSFLSHSSVRPASHHLPTQYQNHDTITVMSDRSSPSRSLPTHLSAEASLLCNGASRQGSSRIMERDFVFCHSVCTYRPGKEAQLITALPGYHFFPFLFLFDFVCSQESSGKGQWLLYIHITSVLDRSGPQVVWLLKGGRMRFMDAQAG
jgi:hypothetical protein